MARVLGRRAFLGRVVAASGAALLGPSVLHPALAEGVTVVGTGPYGTLAATADANGFLLPAGFSSRLLAVSGSPVAGTGYSWHHAPDGGACFAAPGGGWVYVSNSEAPLSSGGASALRFDSRGEIADAYRVLGGTSVNCAGGRTAAGTWLSCEEHPSGQVYECNPLAASQGMVRPALGVFTHEAAYEDPVTGAVYLTEDDPAGRLYRFLPATRGDLSAGQLYAAAVAGGAITWVATSASGPDRQAGTTPFKGGEGIVIEGRRMYFTTKGDKRVWIVDLDQQSIGVLYDGVATSGAPLNAVDNVTVHRPSGDVFVCEDGGNMEVGVLAATGTGDVEVAAFLRIVGHDGSEWAGVAFSPDQTRMYLSSQRGVDGRTGRTYEITGPFRTAPTVPGSTTTTVATTTTTSAPTTTTAAAAITSTLVITSDAHVRDGAYASRNFGTANPAEINTAGTGLNRWYYVKVDSTAHRRPVARAQLRLRMQGLTGVRTAVRLLATSTSWTEAALTWSNRPPPGAPLASGSVTGSTATWVTFDVTAHVNAERAAGRNVLGFVVQAASAGLLKVYSGEAGVVANRPRLVLTG